MVYSIRPISTTGCGITSKNKQPSLLKYIAIAIGSIIAILTVIAFMIPREYHYKKEVDIVAQDRMVFVFLGDLKRWNEWSPWFAKDPKTQMEYSDPAWGAGASYKYKSSFGEGEAKVTQFTHNNSVAYDLIIPGYDTSKWEFRSRPHPRQGVIISWTVDGLYPENRFWRLIAYLMMWFLPDTMEEGLDRLKKHAEAHEAYDVMGDWEKAPAKKK